MKKTLHNSVRLKRRPKYALLNLNKLQAVVCLGASIGLVMLVVKVLQ